MIASKLNIHPYRVKLAKEKSYNYNKEDLLRNLELLYELDYELKSTSIDPYSLLKIFLINA
jgi:DNA polymerase-3 subunit delta